MEDAELLKASFAAATSRDGISRDGISRDGIIENMFDCRLDILYVSYVIYGNIWCFAFLLPYNCNFLKKLAGIYLMS